MSPTKLLIDNQSALNLVKNTEHYKFTKHIDIKYDYIRKLVAREEIETVHVSFDKQLADFLTKPLSRDKFKSNCKVNCNVYGHNYRL